VCSCKRKRGVRKKVDRSCWCVGQSVGKQQNSKTAKQQNSKTAKQQNSKTAKQQNSKTAKQQFCNDTRS
jgi:hypothetical protein